jgi:predicted PurR-regulated permease PerM
MTEVPHQRPTPEPGPGGVIGGLVPEWLANLAALGWRLLVVVAFVAVLWIMATTLSTVTASIAVAVVVSAVFAPFVLRLRAQGRSRNAAAGIVWASAILTIGALLLVLAVALLPEVVNLLSSIHAAMTGAQSEAASAGVPGWVMDLVTDVIDASGGIGGDLVASIVNSAASAVTVMILATFLIFFFLRDGDRAWTWCLQSLGQERMDHITAAGDDALARVGGYLRGTTVLALATAIPNYIFMVLLGTPLAVPLALLSFMAMYIPYFGGIITTLAILLVTYGESGLGTAMVMLVLLSLRTFVVSYVIRPQVYRRTVHLHPALVLIVLPAGFELGGLLGLFAAVPVTAVILTTASSVVDLLDPDPPPPLPELVPAWLDRAAQWSWRLLVAVAVVAAAVIVLTEMPLVVLPIVLALIFAATLTPAVDWLSGRGWSRGRAVALSVSGATLIILLVLSLALVSLVSQASSLGHTVGVGTSNVNSDAGGQLQLVKDALDGTASSVVSTAISVTDDLASLGTVLLLGVLLTFYFLRDGATIWQQLMRHTYRYAEPELTAAGKRAFDVLGGYMIGTGAISFVGALSQWVIMVILGLPLALPVFVLSFFGGFIPYIGSALTTLLAFLITVAVGTPFDILVMGLWTVLFNLVQGNIVAPLVYGRTTHIHPAIVLVSIPAGMAVAGILGMFLVVPAIGVVAATWRTLLHVMHGSGGHGAGETTDPDAGPAGPTPGSEADAADSLPGGSAPMEDEAGPGTAAPGTAPAQAT